MPSKTSRKRRPRKQKTDTKKLIAIIALLAVIAVIVGYVMLNDNSSSQKEEIELTQMKVLFETSMGNITIQLRDDMPITTNNFKNLVHKGVYDGTLFHRIKNTPQSLVMIQGGNAATGNWTGGTIPNIEDEFSENPENNKNKNGTIAMANTGDPNSGNSQFFINADYNSHLDNNHPVFGDVIDGMDVVIEILNTETNSSDAPVEDITLIRATLID